MKDRYTETYIFGEAEYAKQAKGKHLGEQSYSKEDVLAAIESAINTNRLKNAVVVDNPKRSSNVYYVFKMADEQRKDTLRVGVPRSSVLQNMSKDNDEIDPYIRRLNSLKVAGANISFANRVKLAAITGVVLTSTALFTAGFVVGLEKEWQYQDAKQQEYINDINQSRLENGIPPLDVVGENGNPYNSWQQYFIDHPEEKEEAEIEAGKGQR